MKFLQLALALTTVQQSIAKCFTNSDVINSGKLFTYKDKVYDITGYNHPGGRSTLLKCVGQDLSDFFNSDSNTSLNFHLRSRPFDRDLKDMYVGDLPELCTATTEADVDTTATGVEAISSSITEQHSETTTGSNSIVESTTAVEEAVSSSRVKESTTSVTKSRYNRPSTTAPITSSTSTGLDLPVVEVQQLLHDKYTGSSSYCARLIPTSGIVLVVITGILGFHLY